MTDDVLNLDLVSYPFNLIDFSRKILSPINSTSNYSDLRLFTGFIRAALIA